MPTDKDSPTPDQDDHRESRDVLRPADLGVAGDAFYRSMGGLTEDNPARIVLIVQAARLVDRLWAYDRVIHGDDEMFVREVQGGGVIIVRVESVLSAERMTTATLRQITSQLQHTEPARSPDNATPEDHGAPRGWEDQLAGRRAQRGSA